MLIWTQGWFCHPLKECPAATATTLTLALIGKNSRAACSGLAHAWLLFHPWPMGRHKGSAFHSTSPILSKLSGLQKSTGLSLCNSHHEDGDPRSISSRVPAPFSSRKRPEMVSECPSSAPTFCQIPSWMKKD